MTITVQRSQICSRLGWSREPRGLPPRTGSRYTLPHQRPRAASTSGCMASTCWCGDRSTRPTWGMKTHPDLPQSTTWTTEQWRKYMKIRDGTIYSNIRKSGNKTMKINHDNMCVKNSLDNENNQENVYWREFNVLNVQWKKCCRQSRQGIVLKWPVQTICTTQHTQIKT